jgi:hypothetical protein
VYVVVAEGVTVTWPDAGWLPTPLSIETVFALEVDQLKVALCPGGIVAGEAVNELTAGAAADASTVIVACAVAVPLLPVAVSV